MAKSVTPPPSLAPALENVVGHLKQGHDTAFVAAPGCGATTLARRIEQELTAERVEVFSIDLREQKSLWDSIHLLNAIPSSSPSESPRVLIIDHSADLPTDQLSEWLQRVQTRKSEVQATCLWIGALDARKLLEDFGSRLYATPKSHITFPLLSRDETFTAYRAIANSRGCDWGQAILFLMLDFCGNDLALAESATEYLYGKWGERLYDASVWDRVNDWLLNCQRVSMYRDHLTELPQACRQYLRLMRLGGNPPVRA